MGVKFQLTCYSVPQSKAFFQASSSVLEMKKKGQQQRRSKCWRSRKQWQSMARIEDTALPELAEVQLQARIKEFTQSHCESKTILKYLLILQSLRCPSTLKHKHFSTGKGPYKLYWTFMKLFSLANSKKGLLILRSGKPERKKPSRTPNQNSGFVLCSK